MVSHSHWKPARPMKFPSGRGNGDFRKCRSYSPSPGESVGGTWNTPAHFSCPSGECQKKTGCSIVGNQNETTSLSGGKPRNGRKGNYRRPQNPPQATESVGCHPPRSSLVQIAHTSFVTRAQKNPPERPRNRSILTPLLEGDSPCEISERSFYWVSSLALWHSKTRLLLPQQ